MKTINMLKLLGYDVDTKGNVNTTHNQLAIISLEETDEGGILRIHNNPEEMMSQGIGELVFFPTRVTTKFVYFRGSGEPFKINEREFSENLIEAFNEYQSVDQKRMTS